MSDFGTMKERIASEMERSDLGAFIPNAILDAIKRYETQQFWFNESRDLTFNTVAGQWIYTATDAPWISTTIRFLQDMSRDSIWATIGGQKRRLRRVEPGEIESLQDNSAASGQPTCFAYFNSTILLYPTPDQEYAVRAHGLVRLTAPSEDTDTNHWFTCAEQLIRHTAKALLCADVTRDDAEAGKQGSLSELDLIFLKAETTKRRASGTIEPTQF